MAQEPVWKQLYDQLATQLGPLAKEVTASDQFAQVVTVSEAARRRLREELQRSSRRWLHTFNLPAGSDVTMLRREIGELERQVRDLTKRLEDLGEPVDRRDGAA